jgi:cytoskeletal protein CcmA (bactofilin family)
MKLPLAGKAKNGSGMPPPDGAPAVIARGLTVDGTLTGNVDFLIEGCVRGEVCGRSVSIGSTGEIDASVKAYVIDIAGTVKGRLEAMTVNIAKCARIDATIFHHHLNVEKGAAIKGLRPWRPVADMEQRRKLW